MNHMEQTIRVLAISGSLRQASFSTALLKILSQHAPSGMLIEVMTLEQIPLYNEDLDQAGCAPAVEEFRKRIKESDGVLIATPEYNHGIPGVLKNALDWASRPVFKSCFVNKPVSIISSSLAFTGGVRAQYQLRETLIAMSARIVLGPEVVVAGVHTKLAEDAYLDESGLGFMVSAINRLADEIRSGKVVSA